MMRRSVGVALTCAAALPISPASAIDFKLGVSGGISVSANMGACGTITFDRPVVAVGAFTSSGAIAGPGTAVGAVRGALLVTIVNRTSWFGCLPDTYAGATTGYATYTLTATTAEGDFVESLHCVVRSGTVSCT